MGRHSRESVDSDDSERHGSPSKVLVGRRSLLLLLVCCLVSLQSHWLGSAPLPLQHDTPSPTLSLPMPWLKYVHKGLRDGLCGDIDAWIGRMTELQQTSDKMVVADITSIGGGGFGARSRGIASFLTVSLLKRRAFYVDFRLVNNMQDYMLPNLYNWYLPEGSCDLSDFDVYKWREARLRMTDFVDIPWRCFRMQGYNIIGLAKAEGVPGLEERMVETHFTDTDDYQRGCVWNALFKPRPFLVQMVQDTRHKLGISEDIILLGIHARFGGNLDMNVSNQNSTVDPVNRNGNATFRDLLQCAERVERHFQLDSRRTLWYMASDSSTIKQQAKELYPDKVVYPEDLKLLHIGRRETWGELDAGDKVEGFEGNLIDLYMLASADYTVQTSSGFNLLSKGIGMIPDEHTVELIRTKHQDRPPKWNRIC